jgi:hypothetical protein
MAGWLLERQELSDLYFWPIENDRINAMSFNRFIIENSHFE